MITLKDFIACFCIIVMSTAVVFLSLKAGYEPMQALLHVGVFAVFLGIYGGCCGD